MRYFYNIKDGKFNSFYVEGIHNDKIFSKYIEAENKETESEIRSGFFKILEDEYRKIINMGGEIIYKNGELFNYFYPPHTEGYVVPKFNWNIEKWEEGATLEEQEQCYKKLIIQKNKELLNIEQSGFLDNQLKLEIEELRLKYLKILNEISENI